MPFVPLFIVIGIFLAISKILQPDQEQYLQSANDDYDEQALNQALIDYIARGSRQQKGSEYSGVKSSKSGRDSSRKKRQH